MNFFKKFYHRKTLSILDDTQNKQDLAKFRPGSGALRRSSGFSSADNYESNETKLFQEPLANFVDELKNSNKPNHVDKLESGAGNVSVNGTTSHVNATNNLPQPDNSSIAFGSFRKNTASQHSRLPSTLPDEENAPQMMTLYASIIRGEKSSVKKLLTENTDLLETPDNFGRTPLMYCVLSDRLDCAKLLIKMKANLHHVDKAGRSALHLAAHKGSYKFVELLKERGGNIEIQDNDGQTPLHLITRNRDTSCMEFLLRHLSPGMAEVTDNQNRTALHWSAAFNNKDSVRLLIKYNCNAAVSDVEGKTPLHWAANTHDQTVDATLKILLGSSPSTLNWQDYEGRTALHFAVAHENLAAVQALLNFDQEKCELDRLDNTFRTPLHWASQLGNAVIAKLLLCAGANNSISDENGATPLLYAALHNKSDVVSEMIRHDPNTLEQADIDGRTALMWAAGKGANGVIQLLLGWSNQETLSDSNTLDKSNKRNSVMVDINRVDNKGNTALHMASWNGHARSAELLLSCKAKHDLQNNMNHTPLFGACEKGHLSVVEILLDYNASIHLRDLVERTPLHWAAIGGHGDVCDFLIQKGLDPDVRDTYQRSPLHCAAYGGHINCMNLLLENKANVDLQDQEGMSALHWTAQAGHLDATKLLYQCSAFLNPMEFTEERLTPLDHALLNESEDVAQYLMEQDALSSETIRDIAATRIQACYRGYRVRKPFLKRKDLLITHEMLRSKKDRNRGKSNPFTSSNDHLNAVAEEPPRKSPISAQDLQLASSTDELAPDLANTATDVTTIKLCGETAATRNLETPNLPLADFFREDSVALPVNGVKREDDSPDLRFSSVLTSTTPRFKEEGSQQTTEEQSECSNHTEVENICRSLDASITPNLPESSEYRQSEASTSTSALINICTDNATIAGGDTTASEGAVRAEKRRKKKRQREFPSLPASTSSDRLSCGEQSRKVKLKRRAEKQKESSKSATNVTDSVRSSSPSFRAVETSSIKSATTSKTNVSLTPKLVLTTESSALLSLCDGDDSRSHFSSSLNDLNNVGTDDQISVNKVSGLAYTSPNASRHFSQLESFSDPSLLQTTALNSHLSLSEYIESLMSLSLSERKMLETIQKNRKQAFKQANIAATVIQNAWKRYAKKNAPLPVQLVTAVKSDKEEQNEPITKTIENKKAKKKLKKKSKQKTEIEEKRSLESRRSSLAKEKEEKHTSANDIKDIKNCKLPFRRPSVSRESNKKATTSSPITLNLPKPQQIAKSSSFLSSPENTDTEIEKLIRKKKKRPQTCATVSSSLSALDGELKSRNSGTNNTLKGQIQSDVESEHFPRTRKIRPKTCYTKPRRRKNEKSYRQDDLNKKIKELNKVYGQPLLHDRKSPVLKSSIRHPVLPAVRPVTSRNYTSEFDRFHIFNPHNYDPVTAVQSYPVEDWKSLWEKKPANSTMSLASPPVHKKSLKRKKQVPQSKYTFHWKNTYGMPSSSGTRKTTSAAATRFSYNMRATKF